MLATRPPGRTRSAHSSKVSGMPTASMATSAPSPLLRPLTTSSGSSTSLLTVTSAPNCERAFSRRESALSMATTVLGPYRRAVIIAANPTGPAPTIATTSPGWTLPFSTPTSKPVGRMSDRNSTCSSLSPSGSL